MKHLKLIRGFKFPNVSEGKNFGELIPESRVAIDAVLEENSFDSSKIEDSDSLITTILLAYYVEYRNNIAAMPKIDVLENIIENSKELKFSHNIKLTIDRSKF